MIPRLNGFVFISLVVIIFQVSFVLFYNLLKTNNKMLKMQRKITTREANRNIKQIVSREYVMKERNDDLVIKRDRRDDVIKELQKQIVILNDELKKLNNSCYKPRRSAPKIMKDYLHKEMKHEDSLGLSMDSWGYTRTSKPVIPSDWIGDQSVFKMFTSESMFTADSDEPPMNYFTYDDFAKKGRYNHLSYAVNETMSTLIRDFNLNSNANLTLKYGLCRDDINYGTEYEINIMHDNKKVYNMRLIRPLSSLILFNPPIEINLNKLVNIIVPLQGRLKTFQDFLNNFKKVCISRKDNVFLTVVYSGKESLQEVKQMLNTLRKDHEFKNFKLVIRKENFNRGHALHDGIRSWKGEEDILMFFCDVDVVFDSEFLDRCRTFTEPGRTVYYPIVFNQYNPKYVRLATRNLWKISRDTGFWRYYGYGMTCQYRKDYIQVGGFNLRIKGWGSEDVDLHQNFITQNKIRIIRAPDSGLIHHYHTKDCNNKLPWKQYHSCVSTKIESEASKSQYGRRVLEIEESLKIKNREWSSYSYGN